MEIVIRYLKRMVFKMKIGFIGTGVMGSSMVRNLLKNGFKVNVFNRTLSKAQKLGDDGAILTHSVEECVKDVDVVITIVGYPKDVKETYDIILENAKENTILIDMTTSSPSLAINIYNKAKEKSMSALDAPVSGGDIGAKNANLTIMVGGDKEAYDKVYDVFKAMGKTINLIGKAGSGQHTKMANQIAIAANIAGAMEAINYALSQNLDLELVLKAISKGSASSFQLDYGSMKVLNNDYEPGFYIKHFIKDMKIAKEEALKKELLLPVLNQVLYEFEALEAKGYGELGTQALYKYYYHA